ncbi:unnamed protein product, partial [Durusdinium trenchii]
MSPSKAAQAPPPAPPPLHAGPLPAEGPPPVAPPALKAMPAGPAPLPPPTSPAPHNLTSKSAPAAPPHPKPERFVIWIGQKHSTIQSEAGLRKAFAPFMPYEFHSRKFESGGFCLVKTSSLTTAWRIFAFGKKAGLDLGKHPGPQIETVKDTKIAPPLAPNEMNQIWAEVPSADALEASPAMVETRENKNDEVAEMREDNPDGVKTEEEEEEEEEDGALRPPAPPWTRRQSKRAVASADGEEGVHFQQVKDEPP